MSEKLGKFLNDRRMEMSKEEGLSYELLTWRDLARRCGLPETSLARWKEGMGTPSAIHVHALARVFGDGVYAALDMPTPVPSDASPALRFLIRNRNNPAVRAEIEAIQDRLERTAMATNGTTGA